MAVAKGLETEEAPFLAQNNGISASSIRCLFISSNNTKLKEYPGERGTLQSSIREGGGGGSASRSNSLTYYFFIFMSCLMDEMIQP